MTLLVAERRCFARVEKAKLMIKMPCLFVREFHGHQKFTLTHTITPGCEWVLEGRGTASRKRDGTACLFQGGELLKRYDAKKDRKTGEYKLPPLGAIPCCEPDPETGHWPHWVPLTEHDYWHKEAVALQRDELQDGQSYELCGPKLQGNPESFEKHVLIAHGSEVADLAGFVGSYPFDYIQGFLESHAWEGLVFHSEGRYAKIRRKDFGLSWPMVKS